MARVRPVQEQAADSLALGMLSRFAASSRFNSAFVRIGSVAAISATTVMGAVSSMVMACTSAVIATPHWG
jgi:hypothetical protein